MNHSGDAAEQIVRFSLEGVEVAAKIAGDGAKNIATFLYAAMINRDKTKLKGKSRLTSMLKSGKELKVFAVKESDLKKFSQEAKRYGIVYCVLRDKGNADGLCDIMVRADDASKINRIVDRFDFAAVDSATIKSEIVKTKTEKTEHLEQPQKTKQTEKARETAEIKNETLPTVPDKNDTEKLLDELIPPKPKDKSREGKAGKPETEKSKTARKKEQTQQSPSQSNTNPFFQRGRKSRPSEPILKSEKTTDRNSFPEQKESVKEFLTEATARKKQEEKVPPIREEQQRNNKRRNDRQKYNHHRQPQNYRDKSKYKTTKTREEK